MTKLPALIVFGLAVVSCALGAEKRFQLTLHVVNDAGEPVPAAKVNVSYERPPTGSSSVKIDSAEGVTDQNGIVTLEGKTALRGVSYGAVKEGHYQVRGPRYHFKEATWRRWEPWNPTLEVVLKRIRNPVPMYAKRLERGLPALGETISFDLQAGEWLPPHGKGRTADFNFRGELTSRGSNDFDFEITLSFSNPGDGIQRFPPDPTVAPGAYRTLVLYEAPPDGYLPEWTLKRWRRGPAEREQTTFDYKAGYFFRVRSVLNEEGRVVKALYGKIYGDFFNMTYYLNPDGTRNLEYDPKRNLLKSPKPFDPNYENLAP